ncbi:hypothetical protein, partial [Streptococcus sp.]
IGSPCHFRGDKPEPLDSAIPQTRFLDTVSQTFSSHCFSPLYQFHKKKHSTFYRKLVAILYEMDE